MIIAKRPRRYGLSWFARRGVTYTNKNQGLHHMAELCFQDAGAMTKKTGVALLIQHRGHCEPLWAVIPPLQVVLSSACSVASLGRFPSHYLPGRPCLRKDVLADHLFGWGIPSTQQAGHVQVHSAPSAKSPLGAQGGVKLPNMRCVLAGNAVFWQQQRLGSTPGRIRTCDLRVMSPTR